MPSAQNTPTTVGHSWLGESFDQKFSGEEQKTVADRCANVYKLYDSKGFVAAINSKLGHDVSMWCLEFRDAQQGKLANVELPHDGGMEHVVLRFDKTKLVHIRIVWFSFITFAEQLSMLSEKYGKPYKVETVTFQNGYGARREVRQSDMDAPERRCDFLQRNLSTTKTTDS